MAISSSWEGHMGSQTWTPYQRSFWLTYQQLWLYWFLAAELSWDAASIQQCILCGYNCTCCNHILWTRCEASAKCNKKQEGTVNSCRTIRSHLGIEFICTSAWILAAAFIGARHLEQTVLFGQRWKSFQCTVYWPTCAKQLDFGRTKNWELNWLGTRLCKLHSSI